MLPVNEAHSLVLEYLYSPSPYVLPLLIIWYTLHLVVYLFTKIVLSLVRQPFTWSTFPHQNMFGSHVSCPVIL